ncbi:MAG: phosphopantothenoylcysteine decarboxylase, partial [Leucobacter sp.]|nr:phosphopantothenoylcysteine decarboxylase [Leucobacter sp.]
AEPAQAAQAATAQSAAAAPLAGKRVLVSAGGTREAIDPVRYIGNRSSGKQGVALARAAARLGATVELIAANVEADVAGTSEQQENLQLTRVTSTADLQQVMNSAAEHADVIIMAAAVADFRPRAVADTKIRKAELTADAPVIELVRNPDILMGLVEQRRPHQVVVGFAAETARDDEHLLQLGREKLRRKGVDLLVVNPVGWTEGFEADHNSIVVLDQTENVRLRTSGTKDEIASAVLETISSVLNSSVLDSSALDSSALDEEQ